MARKIGVKGAATAAEILGHPFGTLTGRFAQIEAMAMNRDGQTKTARVRRQQDAGARVAAINPA